MKRLVLCGDGTWNVRDQLDENGKRRPTNVTKVARAIKTKNSHGVEQVDCYHDGIDTRGPMDKATGGAFGHGIEENIRNHCCPNWRRPGRRRPRCPGLLDAFEPYTERVSSRVAASFLVK